MNRALLLIGYIVSSCVFLCYATGAWGQEKIFWKGTLEAGTQKLRLEINLAQTDGKWSGELTSLDQNNAKLKLEKIKVGDDTFSFAVPQIRASFEGKLESKGQVAKGTFTQGGAKLPLVLNRSAAKQSNPKQKDEKKSKEKLVEAWVGKLQMGGIQPIMQFRIVETESGERTAYFDSVTEGRKGFKAIWSKKDGSIKFVAKQIKLSYEGKLNENEMEAKGTWSQGGRKFPLTLKKQLTEYESKNVWENRPQRPTGPYPYDALEVKFENKKDKITLAGTLTVPKKPGRHPAVILISGSGPQDRDETLMEHKPFLVLADYLSRRGIAVLRYDDRGTAKSTGKFGGSTTKDFAHDASAAVEFLKTHQRINPKQIGLVGHSEGGLIAPMVAGTRDDVAFVVLLAATGVDGEKIILSQSEAILRAAGTDEEDIKTTLTVSRVVLSVAKKTNFGDDFEKELERAVEKVMQSFPESKREALTKQIREEIPIVKSRMKSNWMRFFLTYDPRPALRKIKCPVLALIGTKDVQVLPKLNMPEIKKALEEGGNQDFEMVTIEGLNHLFQKCETGSLDEYATIQETFNPAALKKITSWIREHTTPIK